MIKILVYIVLALFFFMLGLFTNQYSKQESNGTIFHLKDYVMIYQDGKKIGELYSGAILSYGGSMDEGFQKAHLIMNYYEKPDSLKYYFLEHSEYVNPQFPCWNDRDVQPIDNSTNSIETHE